MEFRKKILAAAALLGFLAVALGAFGAHALDGKISVAQKHTWETGVMYQFFHALGLLWLGPRLGGKKRRPWLVRAAWCWLVGVLLFSGSLYLLACRDILTFPTNWVGPVTPIGGVLFLCGWAMLGWHFLKSPEKGDRKSR